MLEELFATIIPETAQLEIFDVLILLMASLLFGFIISVFYLINHRKKGWMQSFVITLIMLPPVIAIIIILVGNSAARALGLAGAFSLVRFRSAPGDPKDIAYVFFSLAIGLACGIGYIAYAAVFTIILCIVLMILELLNYATPNKSNLSLKITIPENLNYKNLYDDILNKYTKRWIQKRIKTTDFGSLFEISYEITIKNDIDEKEFIDEIRQRNGNLPVQLTLKEYDDVPAG